MGVIARVVGVAACGLSLAVLAAAPTAGAEPTGALPPAHPGATARPSGSRMPQKPWPSWRLTD
ncbi:putative secreted protein [Mycobacterium tuberculosis]|nr:putative secreted protein [Mycobacterium tuberculosis]